MRLRVLIVLATCGVLPLAACDEPQGPDIGTLRISVGTTGGDLDLDGYTVAVAGGSPQSVSVNGTVVVRGLAAGSHDVTLGDVASNCTVSGPNPRAAAVTRGDTTPVSFAVACVATGVEVMVATGGLDIDPNGYAVSVDGAPPLPISVNGTVRITRLSPGTHTVTLTGLVGNCAPPDATNPRSLDVPVGEVVPVAFSVTCGAAHGVVEITAATSGNELDPNGYTVQLDGGAPQALPLNGTVRFGAVSGGAHTVTLADAAGNCTIGGANPRTVSVTAGGITRDTARTTFEVTCVVITGTIEVAVATSGADLPNGYVVGVDWDFWSDYYVWYTHVSANDTVRFAAIPPGNHGVAIEVPQNCTPNAYWRDVTVLPHDTARVTFAVSCVALGSVQVTAVTTGVDLDPAGYGVRVQRAYLGVDLNDSVGTSGTVTFSGLVAGDYVVTLQGAAVNCEVTSANPQTVTVPSGGTALVQFEVACAAAAQLAVVIASDGSEEIYLVKSNGTGLTRLTTNTASDVEPAWSPDGSQVAFATNRDGNYEIYVMNADGQSPVRLTTASGPDHAPAWSPDGSRIVFTSERDGNAEIYAMDADGSNTVRLTNDPGSDTDPAWSPDGSKIAFSSTRDGNTEIYVMGATGSGLTRLTSNTVDDVQPAWSPDGTRLAYALCYYRDNGLCAYGLSVMFVDGAGVAPVIPPIPDNSYHDPAWAGDGRWIAYTASLYHCDLGCYVVYSAVHLVRADGTRSHALMRAAAQPAWRP
jgi:hypothetical protein